MAKLSKQLPALTLTVLVVAAVATAATVRPWQDRADLSGEASPHGGSTVIQPEAQVRTQFDLEHRGNPVALPTGDSNRIRSHEAPVVANPQR
ncbi:MAG: hypothetical protein ACI9HE_003814 [Planctomycetota bacterium]|jgi:hypothetical protein